MIDEVSPEPTGGAHSDWERTAEALRESLVRNLAELRALSVDDLRRARWNKYLSMGEWRTVK